MANFKLSKKEKQYLKKIYYDSESSSSYTGINNILRKIKADGKYKINRQKLVHWLSGQEAYTSYKPAKRSFDRRKIIAIAKNHIWELDCAYMTKYVKYNNKFKFFVLAIDVLSRYVRTFPLKTLQGSEMVKALQFMTKDAKPSYARTDLGSEFIGKQVKEFWKSIKVHPYYSYNEVKCAIAERAIKTFKTRLIKYMHQHKTKKWVNILPKITTSYNRTYHTSIKLSPLQASKEPNHKLYFKQYFNNKPKKYRKFKFNLNDKIKISILKHTFERAYDEKWSHEIFLIADRWKTEQIPIYKIKSITNEPIKGSFYEEELQLINTSDDDVFIIEKIVKKRIKNNKEQSLIKWLGYDTESWINSDQIETM